MCKRENKKQNKKFYRKPEKKSDGKKTSGHTSHANLAGSNGKPSSDSSDTSDSITEAKGKKYLKAKKINSIMIFVSCIVSVFLISTAISSTLKLSHFKSALAKAAIFRNSSVQMLNASKYLTDQTRLFAVTGNIQYVKNYFKEINETKNRDAALEELKNIFNYDEIEYTKLETTFAQSKSLSDIEMYAMKLIFLTGDYDEKDIPEEIKAIKLKDNDKNSSGLDLYDKAMKLLFGSSYLIYRSKIDANCNQLIDSIESKNEKEVSNNFEVLQKRIITQSVALLITFILLVLVFIFNIVYLIYPINSYMKSINSDNPLTEKGSYELRCLAKTYNKFFELKQANERKLKRHAETDPLTGLYNRRAFSEICCDYKGPEHSIAYIIVDIDDFKKINDTYGHVSGDKVLKIIAKELTDTFRTSDYVSRIGGDEFSILLTDFKGNADYAVRFKINKINEQLAKLNDFKKVSISAGAVQSDKGYSPDLVEKADKALYKTKEKGKCGFNIYKEN